MLIVCASILVSTPSLSTPSCDREDQLASPHTSSSSSSSSSSSLTREADASQDDADINGEEEEVGDSSSANSVETLIGFAAVLLEVTLSGFGKDHALVFPQH